MNGAHAHLLVNHLPVVGSVLAVLLLAIALAFRAERGLWLAGLFVLAFTGLGAVAANLTGEPAEEFIEDKPWAAEAVIEEHEERAEVALVAALVGLAVAGGAFVTGRRGPGVAHVAAPLVVAVVVAGLMAWTGAAGGKIRHPDETGGVVAAPGAPGQEHQKEGH